MGQTKKEPNVTWILWSVSRLFVAISIFKRKKTANIQTITYKIDKNKSQKNNNELKSANLQCFITNSFELLFKDVCGFFVVAKLIVDQLKNNSKPLKSSSKY